MDDASYEVRMRSKPEKLSYRLYGEKVYTDGYQ